MNGWKVTIDSNGFIMVLVSKTIGINGFTLVFRQKPLVPILSPATIGHDGFFNGFQW